MAGLSLAIYSLTSSATAKNQVIATNLAREGVEVIRMMRDSNWLLAEPDPTIADPDTTDDVQPCADLANKSCYPKAFDQPFVDLNAGAWPAFVNANYRVVYSTGTRSWALQATNTNFDLYLQADGTYSTTVVGNSNFAREIKIVFNTTGYSAQNPEMIVKSIVAWRAKNCTAFASQDLETLSTPCKILVEEHLTNWRDYK